MPNRPTKEQIQWLWEQCGWKWIEGSSKWGQFSHSHWSDPNNGYHKNLPPIDPNNLFKYAVPKLLTTQVYDSNGLWFRLEVVSGVGEYSAEIRTWNDRLVYETPAEFLDTDPALALFWAIFTALGGK